MFSDLQSSLVAFLDAKKGDVPGAGRLVPALVRPYAGELLAPKRLLVSLPAVFVEFDDARLEVSTLGGSVEGSIGPSVIVAARNAASPAAEHGDGVALLTWTFEALLGASFVIGDYVLELRGLSARRLGSVDVWSARLIPDFTVA